jgi:hypothetical protein
LFSLAKRMELRLHIKPTRIIRSLNDFVLMKSPSCDVQDGSWGPAYEPCHYLTFDIGVPACRESTFEVPEFCSTEFIENVGLQLAYALAHPIHAGNG